jgi:nitrogen fixation/metabolism regulation signal transduction histidine kinase
MFSNEIMQVIMVVCQNSLEIFKERAIVDPVIEMSVMREGDFVTLLIEDNGGGMEEKQLESIFERYTSSKVDGTGLGLYMSYIIVHEHHHARFEIFNNEKGLSTKIVLPL